MGEGGMGLDGIGRGGEERRSALQVVAGQAYMGATRRLGPFRCSPSMQAHAFTLSPSDLWRRVMYVSHAITPMMEYTTATRAYITPMYKL